MSETVSLIEYQERLHQFMSENLNAGLLVRDALRAALKRLADYAVLQNGVRTEVRMPNESEFEALATKYEEAIARYREEQERGAKPVGGGVYAEVVSDDDYAALKEETFPKR